MKFPSFSRDEKIAVIAICAAMPLLLLGNRLPFLGVAEFPYRFLLNSIGHFTMGATALWLIFKYQVNRYAFLVLIGAVVTELVDSVLGLPSISNAIRMDEAGTYVLDLVRPSLNDLAVSLIILGFTLCVISASRSACEIKIEQAKLHTVEQRFFRLLEITGVVPWELDVDRELFTYLGPNAVAVLRYPREQMLQPGFWARFVHPDDRRGGVAWIRRLLAGQDAGEIDFRFCRPDGEYRWLRELGGMGPMPGEAHVVRGFTLDVTRERQAAAEFAQREEVFRRSFEHSPMGMTIVDRSTRLLQVNRAFADLLGYEPDELIGRSYIDFTHPDYRESDTGYARRIFDDEIPHYRREKVYLAKDGSHVWVSVTATSIRDPDGNILSGLGMIENITQRKQAEDALRQAHEQLERRVHERTQDLLQVNQALQEEIVQRNRVEAGLRESSRFVRATLDSIAAGVAILDSEGEILAVNETWRQFSRNGTMAWSSLSIGDNYLRSCAAVVGEHASTAASLGDGVRAVLQGEMPNFRTEYENNTASDPHWIAVRVNRFADEGPARVVVAHYDITPQKRTQMALEEREAQVRQQLVELQNLYHSAPFGLCLLDSDFRYIRINDRLAAYTGTPAAAHVGKHIREVVPEFALILEPFLRKVLETGKPISNIEIKDTGLRARSQDRVWSSSYYPVLASEGTMHIGCIVQETTDQKRMQAQLAVHQAELAHATRLSMLGELASGLAHELNQPLSAITNYARGSLRRLATPSVQLTDLSSALEQIDNEARRAAEIIRRLRDFIRKRRPKLVRMQFNDAVREAMSLIRFESEKLSASIELALDDCLPPIFGDQILLEQVMLNLVRNSLEAVGRSTKLERRVIITTKALPNQIEVRVQDNGPGLPEDVMPRLFEPFFSTREDGLGMGLSISRSIVEAHYGCLQPVPGDCEGAVFQILLPINDGRANHGQ